MPNIMKKIGMEMMINEEDMDGNDGEYLFHQEASNSPAKSTKLSQRSKSGNFSEYQQKVLVLIPVNTDK